MPKTTPAPTALHDPALRQVRATAIALENATIARDAAMVAAKEAGAGVTDIARAAGISRPSVYRVLRREIRPACTLEVGVHDGRGSPPPDALLIRTNGGTQ